MANQRDIDRQMLKQVYADYAAAQSKIALADKFVEWAEEHRNGSPNAFYAAFDVFRKEWIAR